MAIESRVRRGPAGPIEVAVWFAGTLLEVVVVAPGRTFRLGTAPGVEVAVTGLFSFPLVDAAGLIRLPAGISARRNDGGLLAAGAPIALASDATLALAIGRLGILLAVAAPVAPLVRPPLDRRSWPYLGIALVAHLIVWVTAMQHPPAVAPSRKPTQLLAHLAKTRPPPPIPDQPPPPRPQSPETGGASAMQHVVPRAPVGDGHVFGTISGADLARLIGTVELGKALRETTGPVVPQLQDSRGFGGAATFDPSKRPGFETIKTGRYATVAHGRGAGDEYRLSGEQVLGIELCATKACVARGAIDRASVHSWIAPHAEDFRPCFDGTSDVLVDFTIAHGVVHGAHGRGASGRCAAAVVSGIAFPNTDGTTRVRYGVTYRT